MVATYRFKLNAQKAEFYPAQASYPATGQFSYTGCAVVYGPGCIVLEEEYHGTLAGALARLAWFAKQAPAPSRSFLRLAPGERTPRGFKQARTTADNTGA